MIGKQLAANPRGPPAWAARADQSASPKPSALAARGRFGTLKRALGDKPEGGAPPRPVDSSSEEPDFWEGESFELLGQISSFALPIFVVMALAVGFFASSTYNNDADVFLDSPRSDQDTAKLYKFE